MYCYNCGHELSDNARFCGNCGAKTDRTETAPCVADINESETEREVSMTVEQILQEERRRTYNAPVEPESSKQANSRQAIPQEHVAYENSAQSTRTAVTVPDWRPAEEGSSSTLLRAILWTLIGIICVCAELCVWFFTSLDLGGTGLFKYAVMGCILILSVAMVIVVKIATDRKSS